MLSFVLLMSACKTLYKQIVKETHTPNCENKIHCEEVNLYLILIDYFYIFTQM